MLDLPDAQIFQESVSPAAGNAEDAAHSNTGPVLGGTDLKHAKGETVRIAKPVLPVSKADKPNSNDMIPAFLRRDDDFDAAGEESQDIGAMPVLKSGDSDYQKRYDEAAQIYGSDAYNIKRIEELRRRNVPIVLFLGMRTTGKTWLIQRMKHMLDGQFDCHPAVKLTHKAIESDAISTADETEQRQKYLGRAELSKAERRALEEQRAAGDSGRTSAMIFHEFEPINDGDGNEFVLVDVPGEDFRLLADGQYSAIRSLACALKYAGTVIVALPSDITLLGSRVSASEFDAAGDIDAVRADHDFVQKLTGSLADMSKMRSILLSKNVDVAWKPDDGEPDAYDRAITAENLRAHTWKTGRQPFGGEDGMGCPVYIALTKADKFFAASKKLPDMRGAPADLVEKLADANTKLGKVSDGQLFAQLFQSSALNLKNLLETPGWLGDTLKVLIGKRSHVAPISNPPEMLLQANDGLFNRLNANFPMSRIDLVAAFYGHTGNTLCLADLEDHPEIGVKQMTDWLAKVHDDGINSYHGWARSAFARIYRTDEQIAGPTGGVRKKIHNWRLRFLPSQMLAAMFRKEFHPLQIMPALIAAVVAITTLFLTVNFLEPTAKVNDTARYDKLVEEIDSATHAAGGQGGSTAVEALKALPALPDSAQRLLREGKISTPYAKALWNPVAGLTSWSMAGNGYAVPPAIAVPVAIEAPQNPLAGIKEKPTEKRIREAEQNIASLRKTQLDWQSRYVCGLEGWGEYRAIVRKAVLQGYGDCSGLNKLALHSPIINMMQQLLGWWGGALAGLILMVGLWAAAAALIVYASWFYKTRAAYGWLYHSGVATTQRADPAPAEQVST